MFEVDYIMTPTCDRCGEPVSKDFARVFGDNDDRVNGCSNCGATFPFDDDTDDDDDPSPAVEAGTAFLSSPVSA